MTSYNCDYPKVLVVGQPFHRFSGGGVTISNLFSNWSTDKLFSLNTSKEAPAFDVCKNVYMLGYKDRTPALLRPFVNNRNKNMIFSMHSKNYDEIISGDKSNPHRSKYRNTLYKFSIMIGLNNLHHQYVITEEIKRWLFEIKPDILYAQYADYPSMLFILKLHKLLAIPLVVHIVDDWISIPPITNTSNNINTLSIVNKYWTKKNGILFTRLLECSSSRIAISELMAEEYTNRYGMNFTWAHNYVNPQNWLELKEQSSIEAKVIIGYFGSINIKNVDAFNDMLEAIQSISNHDIILRIFTNSIVPDDISKSSCVEIRQSLDTYAYKRELLRCKILFLPLGFSDISIRYSQLSIPTKLAEYLISGVPALVYAHKDTALYKFCYQTASAYVVSEKSPPIISFAIKKLIEDKKMNHDIVKNAINVVSSGKISAGSMTDRFEKVFLSLINN
ncbi:MAG: hypothetical protein HQ521_03470 [Bacteroidetes bacterium]|nr:hypothetical protein [Bacteroidota bacterium]